MEDFSAAGLTDTEAKVYKALLTRKEWLPSELAQNVNETRTNIYKILERLTDAQLAERVETQKKLRYRAQNPARLLELAREKRRQHDQAEKELEIAAQSLVHDYIAVHEQPAFQFFQGKNEIKQIFLDIAAAKTPVSFVSTIAGIDFYGFDHMHHLRMLAVNAGVKRAALTPDTSLATSTYRDTDKLFGLTRTWLQSDDYTSPVEWGVFDDKLYIISYGNEAMGVVIESPQIAEAFKQLWKLIDRGQKAQPWYDQLPKLAQKPAITD